VSVLVHYFKRNKAFVRYLRQKSKCGHCGLRDPQRSCRLQSFSTKFAFSYESGYSNGKLHEDLTSSNSTFFKNYVKRWIWHAIVCSIMAGERKNVKVYVQIDTLS